MLLWTDNTVTARHTVTESSLSQALCLASSWQRVCRTQHHLHCCVWKHAALLLCRTKLELLCFVLLLQQRVWLKDHAATLQSFLDQRGEDYDDCRGLPALVRQLQLRAMTSSRTTLTWPKEQMLCVWAAECMV